jgi:hypothetical protein
VFILTLVQTRVVIPDKPRSGADPESIEGGCPMMDSGPPLRCARNDGASLDDVEKR